MASQYNVAIVGAGIVGLATAYQALLQHKNLHLLVIEKEDDVARHQSGNNSGVIHSGVYYKPGSSKARNCLRGYELLLDFCNSQKIPYEICGKVIVATNESELTPLDNIYKRGLENGLQGLSYLNEKELNQLEPFANGIKAVHVPQTGIIDYSAVCRKLADLIKIMGGEIKFGKKVTAVKEEVGQVRIILDDEEVHTDYFVNCAGLYSDDITRMVKGTTHVQIIPFRGEYYELKPEKTGLVNNLIYPVPDPEFPFLGVHFTRMINGGVEAGPNAVLALSKEGYKKTDINFKDIMTNLRYSGFRKVSKKYWRTGLAELYRSFSKSAFTVAVNKLIPSVTSDDLVPGGSGVRAQACDRDGNLIDDFYFEYTPRTLHVCNAPSPAATASLAIGEEIVKKIQEKYQ